MHLFRHQAPPSTQGGQLISEVAFITLYLLKYISGRNFEILGKKTSKKTYFSSDYLYARRYF